MDGDQIIPSVKTRRKIRARIDYKLLCIVHNCKCGKTPQYLIDLLTKQLYDHYEAGKYLGISWDGNHQKQLQQKTPPQQEIQIPHARCPQTLNYQRPQNTQMPNQETQIDQYPSQTKFHKQRVAEMEKLNAKYNLDCFSESELDSESDEGEQYKYEHKYETLI